MILLDHPLMLLVATVAVLWIASRLGFYIHKHTAQPLEPDEDDFALILGATPALVHPECSWNPSAYPYFRLSAFRYERCIERGRVYRGGLAQSRPARRLDSARLPRRL